MLKQHNPAAVAGPHGEYSFGIEAPAGARWLYLAGQVGTRPDGSVPEDVGEQVECAFRNIFATLESAGMTADDLVGMTSYLTNAADWIAYRDAKARMIGDARPTSTLLVVSALAKPEWKVEITAWAAKA